MGNTEDAGLSFTRIRTITVAGFAADAWPNGATEPVGSKLFQMRQRVSGQSGTDNVWGHALYFRYVDGSGNAVEGGTVNFKTWIKDAGASGLAAAKGLTNPTRWVGVLEEAAAPGEALFQGELIGQLYVQVKALPSVPVGATAVELWIVDRAG